MTPMELGDRVERGENIHTEFKEARVHPDAVAAALVAFANTDGGELLVGVADDRTISGVADTDRVMRVSPRCSSGRRNLEPGSDRTAGLVLRWMRLPRAG